MDMVGAAPRESGLDLGVAVAQASRQLAANPAAAKAVAVQILKAFPGNPQAALILGSALRRLGELTAAHRVLSRLALDQPDWTAGHYELGMVLSALGQAEQAQASFRRATAMTPSPDMAPAWRALGDLEMAQATEALARRDIETARSLLEKRLHTQPVDVAALRLLAELETLKGQDGDAEVLLTRGVAVAPDAPGLRQSLAVTLLKQFKAAMALTHIDRILESQPANLQIQALKATALTYLGECDQAATLYEHILAARPEMAPLWLSYGDTLKIAGRQQDSIAAYRRAIQLSPSFGKAYWSLANLKSRGFTGPEITAMQTALNKPGLSREDRLHLHFALGEAFEAQNAFATSFHHYQEGAGLWRAQAPYSADHTTELLERSRAVFTAELFEARRGQGCPAPDPIFIVGLPRSGSTLVEQILASHSAVEGTMELADLGQIAAALGSSQDRAVRSGYPEKIEALDGEMLAALGRSYLESTAPQRRTGRPFFVDKMPYNFHLLGLIHVILPNAKIVDVRRHPMATCFSAFKQHFPVGQRFSYSLDDVGRYYRDYVALMNHFDAVLPERVYRIRYEALIDNFEEEVRKLLVYCKLPFEGGCLKFHENPRVVRTASSEQVRRPIFREGLDQWRNFEPWLDPLKTALGPALYEY
jgi:tetratricopeptide (TPR) repeat protein